MDFELTPGQELLRESVRRFLAENAPLSWVRQRLAEPRGTTDAVWKGLVELGLPGLLVPEEQGGAGLGMLEMGVVLEEMGRALLPGPYLASALAATSLVRGAATPEERKELLPPLAAGERLATLAVYEPGRRYAWHPPATEARRAPAGWQVSGAKAGVLDAAAVDWILVVARDPEARTGLFLIEREAPGVEVAPEDSVDGTRKQARVSLSEAPARRLGTADVWGAIEATLERVAIGLAADGVGAAARAHELALAYARERVQFDRPIGSFQAVQHRLVDMLQDLELARAGTTYALWAADVAPAEERQRAAAMAKAFASDALPALGAAAIQVFGGVGFTWEYDVHLYYKRLLSLQHAFGDAAWHLEALARIALEMR